MRKSIFLLFFMNMSFFCLSEEKLFKYPNNANIREYISCQITLTSIRCEDYIYPSCEILLKNNKNVKVKELEIKISYYYGQNFDFIYNFMIVLDEEQINAINNKGEVIIKHYLQKIKRESNEAKDNSLGYVKPDGEYIEDIFYKLRCDY